MKAHRASAVSSGDEQDGAYTVERFAIKHAISRAQAYVEIAGGRLIARKVGARTIITREDAARWRRVLPKISAKDAEAKTPDGRGSVKPKHEKSSGRRKPPGFPVAPKRAQSRIRTNTQQISEQTNNKSTNAPNKDQTNKDASLDLV